MEEEDKTNNGGAKEEEEEEEALYILYLGGFVPATALQCERCLVGQRKQNTIELQEAKSLVWGWVGLSFKILNPNARSYSVMLGLS